MSLPKEAPESSNICWRIEPVDVKSFDTGGKGKANQIRR